MNLRSLGSWRRPRTTVALGLYARDDVWHRVEVQRDGSAHRVTDQQAYESAEALASAMPGTDAAPPALGLAVADLHGVHRVIDLPPADAATTHKLAALQLETLLPGQQEHVRWGWQRTAAPGSAGKPGGGYPPALGASGGGSGGGSGGASGGGSGGGSGVLLFAASRGGLDRAMVNLPDGATPTLVTPAVLAFETLLRQASPADRRVSLTAIAVDALAAHLIVYRQGRAAHVETIDLDDLHDAGPEHVAQTLAARCQAMQKLPAVGDASESFTLLADAEEADALQPLLAERLGRRHQPFSDLVTLPGLEITRAAACLAAGAALAALHPGETVNLVADTPEEHEAQPIDRRRWAIVTLWLLAALAALYMADQRTAAESRAVVQAHELTLAAITDLDTQLAVARHLETAGPTFFTVLDELSQRTRGFTIDGLRYEREGQLTIRGTQRSAGEISRIAAELAQMRTLGSVQVRSQTRSGRDQLQYTIVAAPNPRYLGAFVPPAPTADDTGETEVGRPTADNRRRGSFPRPDRASAPAGQATPGSSEAPPRPESEVRDGDE